MTGSTRLALSGPLECPDVPIVQLLSTTRRAEARTAMATVAALRDHGVPIRDVVVVVRDLDPYEEPLSRAAVQFGIAPAFWTQLRVTRTRPYALVESICAVLAAAEPDRETLFRPLEHRWSPPNEGGDAEPEDADGEWPIESETLYRSRHAAPRDARPIDDWAETLGSTPDVDPRVVRFVEWVTDAPAARPEAVGTVLSAVVEAYADRALPATRAADSPALLDTETDARAVVRLRTLVGQLSEKFADRLADGTVERSWRDVADLAGAIATQRPGRREHSNARALDVLEANDVWALEVPYVVAVGVVDGEWPQRTASSIPPEFQEAVLAGTGDAGALAPRTAWTDGRDRDQFADTLRAAENGLVLTRHTRTADGETVHPSPLLDHVDGRLVPEPARRALVSPEQKLPAEIRAMLPDTEVDGDG